MRNDRRSPRRPALGALSPQAEAKLELAQEAAQAATARAERAELRLKELEAKLQNAMTKAPATPAKKGLAHFVTKTKALSKFMNVAKRVRKAAVLGDRTSAAELRDYKPVVRPHGARCDVMRTSSAHMVGSSSFVGCCVTSREVVVLGRPILK